MPAFPNLAMSTDMLANPDAEYTARLETLDATIKAELEAAGLVAMHVAECVKKGAPIYVNRHNPYGWETDAPDEAKPVRERRQGKA